MRESERGREPGDEQCRDVGHDAESEDRATSEVAAGEEVVEPDDAVSGRGCRRVSGHAGQGYVRPDPVEADGHQSQDRQRSMFRNVLRSPSIQCSHRLPPEPPRRPTVVPLFIQVAHQGAAGTLQPAEEPCRQSGWGHGRPPSSCGRPAQSTDSASRVERASRTPSGVARKYRFARPPRSGVGSPSRELTRPFSCRRSSAA